MTIKEVYNAILNTKNSRDIRQKYLEYIKENTQSHLINQIESERGLNGGYHNANVDVWNAYEYAPWKLTAPLTLIVGDLNYIDEDSKLSLANVEIRQGAKVLVVGNITAGSLFVLKGELQCLGIITIKHNLVVSSSSYLYANKINTENYGNFGTTNCSKINVANFVKSEIQVLKLLKNNSDIDKLKADNYLRKRK